ncbi:MAG: hypothetical protein DRI94_00790 [Bacteroidetes bacterium]|nr:MAG: hypothetical protein DRI94_00790 [Bacteroidota bacterium]
MSEKFDVIIIGAGLSGLLSASLLSRKGLKVCILEKNKDIGGMIQPFRRNGLSLDTGMNFFGACKKDQIQYKLFEIFGIADDVLISEISDFELIIDNKKFILPNNFNAFKTQLISYFPEEKKGIIAFIEKIKEISESLIIDNINFTKTFQKYYSESASEFIKTVTKNKELQNLLKFNSLLYGNNFETLPLYIYAAITGSFLQSAEMFTKGTKHFIEIIINNIYKNSGIIYTNKEVSKIKTEENKVTYCVCNDGLEYHAKYFLSTIHPQNLLPKIDSALLKSFYRKRISELPNSKGVLIINVILKEKKIIFDKKPKFINSNNESILVYHPVSGKKKEFSGIIKIMCEDNMFDYEKWVHTKTGRRGKAYYKFKREKAERIILEVEKIVPGFSNAIYKYYVSTPLTFKDFTGSPEGSAYGILKNFNKISETILPINTKFNNLYLTGQSINFHGLLGVSLTSVSVCSAIMKKKIFD